MPSPYETLKNSFPGPRLAGVACILAPALLIAGSYLLHPTAASAESHVLSYQPDPARVSAGLNFFMAGAVFAALAGVTVARLAAAKQPFLASLGGFLVLAWAATGAYFGGVMWMDVALTKAADAATAEAVGAATGMMPVPALVGTLGLLVGWTILAFAAARAGVLRPINAVGLGAVCLVPVAVAFAGQPLFAVLPLAGMAVGLVPLGLALLRGGSGKTSAVDRGASA